MFPRTLFSNNPDYMIGIILKNHFLHSLTHIGRLKKVFLRVGGAGNVVGNGQNLRIFFGLVW